MPALNILIHLFLSRRHSILSKEYLEFQYLRWSFLNMWPNLLSTISFMEKMVRVGICLFYLSNLSSD